MEPTAIKKPELITLSYSHLAKFPMEQALRKLNQTSMPEKLAYSVGKVAQEVEQTIRDVRKGYVELCKKFDPEWVEGSGKELNKKDREEEFTKLEEEYFEKTTVTLKRPKIDFGSLHAQLAPAEVMALEPIFTNLPN